MSLLGRPLSLLPTRDSHGRLPEYTVRVTDWTYILIVYHQYVALLFIRVLRLIADSVVSF